MNRKIETRILDSRLGSEWPMPDYATDGAAAIDLRASMHDSRVVNPGHRRRIHTGIAIHIADPGIVGIVSARSGLALNHGIRVCQGAAIIDSDYQGELIVPIINDDPDEPYLIQPGERIAQLMFMPVERVRLEPVAEFSAKTARGAGGFGSTDAWPWPVDSDVSE